MVLCGLDDKNAALRDTNEANWISISEWRSRGVAGEAAAGGDTQISLEGLWERVLRGAEGRLQAREAECVHKS